MPDNVLHDHDGVVHHKPYGNRQAHDRQIVEAVAQQVHDAERGHQRQRYRQAGNQRRRGFAQKHKDHHDHQAIGQQQGELHVVDRRFDGLGTVTTPPAPARLAATRRSARAAWP